MNASSVEEDQRVLFILESAFEKSVSQEVPTYAPTAFAHARRRLDDVRSHWYEYRTSESLREQIALVSEALEEANAKARASSPVLASLVRARSQAIRSSALAHHASQELSAAEPQYHLAVRHAEEQDSDTRDLVAAVERIYVEATIKSLEEGAGRHLKNQVEYARGIVSGEVLARAEEALDELRPAYEAARRGEMPLHSLKAVLANRGGQLRRLLDVQPDGPLDLDASDPPLAPPGGGLHPETFSRPKAPTTMRIKERTPNALTVVWRDLASFDDVNLLERSIADGPWEVIAEFGPVSGWPEFEDTGLAPDTLHRYRVRVQNEFGSSVTTHDNSAVGLTRMVEDLPVRRVQLYVRVADIPDAGTTDALQARLSSPLLTYSPNSNNTWLDHAPRLTSVTPLRWEDDFHRAGDFTYDVDFTYVRQLGDITMISLRKDGSDAIGIAEIALKVNGQEAFRKFFGETSSTCLWLDDGDGFAPIFTVYHPELRAHNSWQSYVQSPPCFPDNLPNDEIVSRFEAIVGDSLHGTQACWRTTPRPVRVTRVNDEAMHVRLLLAGEAPGPINPDIDVSFDLSVTISCNRTATEATLNLQSGEVHANADFGLLVDLLSLTMAPGGVAAVALANYVEAVIERAVRNAWEPIVKHLAIEPPVPGFCPKVQVDQDADGDANLRFRAV